MSPCSHAQQHDRRSLANGRQTSSTVSASSQRAALSHRCHWLSWPHLSCHWLRCGLATCAHTHQPPRPSTQTPLSLQGCSPWVKRQTGLLIGAGSPLLHIASFRCGIRWIKGLAGNPLSRAASHSRCY